MHVCELLKKQIVVSHGEEDARRGEHHTVGGAEGRNQNGERNKFAGPGAKHATGSGGGNGIAGRGISGSEREQVSDYREKVKHGQKDASSEEGSRKRLLRVHNFASAVGAELP